MNLKHPGKSILILFFYSFVKLKQDFKIYELKAPFVLMTLLLITLLFTNIILDIFHNF